MLAQLNASTELLSREHARQFTELLEQIKSIDFRAKSGLPDEGKISRKIYVVVTVDEVLDVATANNWGLATRDGFIYIFNGEYWQPVGADDFKPFLAKSRDENGCSCDGIKVSYV